MRKVHKLPIGDKDLKKYLSEYGDDFIITFSKLDKPTKDNLIKLYELIKEGLGIYEGIVIGSTIPITENHHRIYELMKYMYDHKELNTS